MTTIIFLNIIGLAIVVMLIEKRINKRLKVIESKLNIKTNLGESLQEAEEISLEQ